MSPTASEQIPTFEVVLDAVERRDRDAIDAGVRSTAHEDCEWVPLIGSGIEGSYHGPGGVVRFYNDLLDTFSSVHYRNRDWRAIGEEAALFLCVMELRGRGSDLTIGQPVGVVIELEDGLIRHGRVYGSQEEALAAAEALGA